MQYSFISATLLAIASFATAQTAGFDAITSPAEGTVATAGSPLEIVWQPQEVTGPITITLLQGATPSTLQLGDVVAAGIENSLGTFTWNIPTTVGSFATYGFQITLDAEPTTLQYSFPFSITGSAASSSVASSGAVSSTGSATSTTTIRLTQATSTSTFAVTATSANVTSSAVESSATSSTTAVVTGVSSNGSSNSSSNISTTLTQGTATRTSSSGSSATSSGSITTTSANAAANIATGGLAMIGGLFIALAL